MPTTTVDILMATYNGESYVAEQIESIQHQTHQDWQLLVSDDCSTDGTLAIVRSYAAKDPRISVVSEGVRHGGARENFMSLLGLSTSPYAMFCDQDDVWHPDKVAVEAAALMDAEGRLGAERPIVVHTDLSLVDEHGEPLGSKMSQTLGVDVRKVTPAQMVVTGCVTGCTMAFNQTCARVAAHYHDLGNVIMHDWWLALVAEFMGERVFLDECSVDYRQHSGNAIGASRASANEVAGRYALTLEKSGLSGVARRLVFPELKRSRQAGEFLECYGDRLDRAQSEALAAIAGLPNRPFAGRLGVLRDYGLWRRGTRNALRQLLAMALMGGGRNAE